MPFCAAHIWGDPQGLSCSLPLGHDPSGHVFESTSAGDDRHTDGGHG